MKSRSVIEIETETYEEEQFILARFPHTAWIKLSENTRFYVPTDQLTKVAEVMAEWSLAEKGVR